MDKARAAFSEVLLREADAALQLSHSDICKSLQDALSDMFPGQYAYVRDVFGDDESGDVIYCCGSDIYKASYEIGLANGNRTTSIDTANQVNVLPRTVYDEEADEDDHMADMSSDAEVDEAFKTEVIFERFPGSKGWKVPLRERFISKAERDAADSSDFAGKGKSYPILKPGDVQAAVHAMGRAGSDNKSTNALKAAIIRIAKRKGWTKYLPKAWRGDGDSKESVKVPCGTNTDALVLVESAATLETILLKEARADYEIKLIAPGKGSSAFYPKEVLQRDGPKVFTAGTHVYLNHPTAAEESARPEGDVKNLAGVLTTAAAYQESHPKGEGLYARMKVFADHGQMVEEKATYVGMSIRASGIAESGKSKDGLPVLKELTHAESVDVVTRAGAGGMILTESAKPGVEALKKLLGVDDGITTQEAEMTAEEAKALIQTAVKEAVAPLHERIRRDDAREEATKLLESVTLPQAAKIRIIDRACATLPMKDGQLDLSKLRESVVEESKAEGRYLAEVTGSGRVVGLGAPGPVAVQSKEARKEEKRRRKESERLQESAVDAFIGLGMPKKAAKLAAREDVA